MDQELSFGILFLGVLVLLYFRIDLVFLIVWIMVWLGIEIKFLEKEEKIPE